MSCSLTWRWCGRVAGWRHRSSRLFLALTLCLWGCVPVASTRLSIGTEGLEPEAIRGAIVAIASRNGLVADFYPDSISRSDPFRLHEGWEPGWVATFGYPKNAKLSTQAHVRRNEQRAVLVFMEHDIEDNGLSPEVLRLASSFRADAESTFGASNVVEER